MTAIAMGTLLVLAFGMFIWSAGRRWLLMVAGAPDARFDRIGERIKRMFVYAFFQRKLPWYPLAGFAHMLIFWGFLVLLLNTMILWGKAFDPDFGMFFFHPGTTIGDLYFFVKDLFVVLVVVATAVALFNRVVLRPARLTLSFEATLILLIIFTMMVAEGFWGAWEVRKSWGAGGPAYVPVLPFGSVLAMALAGLDTSTMEILGWVGYWVHVVLVLVFLNILPYGKHFHVVTSIPNVFLSSLKPAGYLAPDAGVESQMKEDAAGGDAEPIFGVGKVEQLTWKGILDLYSCTECGRCSDNCPAAITHKKLSPKMVICDLRDNLKAREGSILGKQEGDGKGAPAQLVPEAVDSVAVWDCTTCRACEDQCPLLITHPEKIVSLRRNLVLDRGEIPSGIANALRGLENNGNPWSLSPMDRGKWAEVLGVEPFDSGKHDVLYFAGCAASYDDRAQKISQATARLLKKAGVKFGILGADEPCCGDLARRAGNEFLFRMMADTLVGVFRERGVKKIVTPCPHGYNIFKNEYPDFGGTWEVEHHSRLLARLVQEGKLPLTERVEHSAVFHDPCYLGRYNGVYEAPRDILRAVPGMRLLEPERTEHRALCCGAGGAQFFTEESNEERISQARTAQLLKTGAEAVITACPFCMTMISDGLKAKDLYDLKGQLDISEVLDIACGTAPHRKLLREKSDAPA